MSNIKVSSDVDTMLRSATNAQIRSNIGAGSETQVNSNATNISSIGEQVDINVTNISSKADIASPTFTGTATASTIKTREIQCFGTTTGSAEPINYDSNEHRFRDYDASPTNLLVIEKIDGYTGARVGINKEPSSSNAVALHIVAGKNSSTDEKDLGLKVTGGGAFFEKFLRVGHYTDTERDAINNPTNGTVIYNETHHEFQGYIGGGGGTAGWKKFTMSNVST